MSIKIPIDNLSLEQVEIVKKELTIRIKGGKYAGGVTKYVHPYFTTDKDIYIPMSFAFSRMKLKRKPRSGYPEISEIAFVGSLREEQIQVRKEALEILSKTGSVILSLYTGCGKTFCAINLACKIKLKTLIVVNKLILIKQWEKSIIDVCPTANIQKLTTKSDLDEDCDFYIINAINVEKFEDGFFDSIGCLIIDELHLILAETLCKSLQHVEPRYLIGLSATAYREDGLDVLINIFFGENRIIRTMFREHIVYCVYTGFTPEIVKTEDDKLNWSALLKDQSEDEERNNLSVSIVSKHKDRTFLILTKRVEQGRLLFKKLEEAGEVVSSLIGKEQEFDRSCRILVGTTSKCGTGFDFPELDALILASDMNDYFVQALGRIFRKQDTIPIVFDLVDNNPVLMKHYKNRKEVYVKHGGKIIGYKGNKTNKVSKEGKDVKHKRLL